ncbi:MULTISPECIES: hypothetical protein [unclassified Methanoculleus]|uniref:hypothetical protein n=1 Tax=unclassified Methanoculleus TaxID=2619537 RepID=UPI0025ECA3C6|nr:MULTISPECIES: hypothetical protein [unclassified Methanoculleus]
MNGHPDHPAGAQEHPVEVPAAANAAIPVLLREEALDIARENWKRRFMILEPEERFVPGERVYRSLHRRTSPEGNEDGVVHPRRACRQKTSSPRS